MNKELSDDQRSRLEQIARDEFNIKQREISLKKQNELNEYVKKENAKIIKSDLAKKYLKLETELNKLKTQLQNKGFFINHSRLNGDYCLTTTIRLSTDTYSQENKKDSPYLIKYKTAKINNDLFTRSLNKVLSVIWSMEKPFSECIKLIESEVKKIK